MKDILLIFPAIHNGKDELRYPPFGLIDMASYVEKYGYQVDLFDRNIVENTISRLIQLIDDEQYRYIGISSMFIQKDDAQTVLEVVQHHHNGKVLVGGDYFVCFREHYRMCVDYVVCGDGEIFLKELLETEKEKGIYETQGLNNIDEIPIPTKRILDSVAWDKKVFAIKTSRGCPFHCIFCSSTNNDCTKVRFHSAEYIISYLEFIMNTYDIRKFRFMDDVFTLNKKRLLELCGTLRVKKWEIEIEECFSHISVRDPEIFEAMANVGFKTIQVGVESGDDEILKSIGKGITVSQIRDTINIIRNAGLKVEGLFMMGNIGETKESIMKTIELMKSLPTYKDWFSFACPLPNSKFYKIAEKYGTIITDNYNRYTNAEVVFVPNGLTKDEMNELMLLARKEARAKIIRNIRNS